MNAFLKRIGVLLIAAFVCRGGLVILSYAAAPVQLAGLDFNGLANQLINQTVNQIRKQQSAQNQPQTTPTNSNNSQVAFPPTNRIQNLPASFQLAANIVWYDTGIDLTNGQTITINASGTVTVGALIPAYNNETPAGRPELTGTTRPGGALVAPGLAPWSLVGRIGSSGKPFEIGTSKTFTASDSGRLYLSVNDNWFPDNSGSWNVTVTGGISSSTTTSTSSGSANLVPNSFAKFLALQTGKPPPGFSSLVDVNLADSVWNDAVTIAVAVQNPNSITNQPSGVQFLWKYMVVPVDGPMFKVMTGPDPSAEQVVTAFEWIGMLLAVPTPTTQDEIQALGMGVLSLVGPEISAILGPLYADFSMAKAAVSLGTLGDKIKTYQDAEKKGCFVGAGVGIVAYGQYAVTLNKPLTVASTTAPPVIGSVSVVAPQQTQTITISGIGFGTQNAFNGTSKFLKIHNDTANWDAGYNGDWINLNVSQWTDTQIVIKGFTGAYGLSEWKLNAGDKLTISVWNAQTGNGPVTFNATVRSSDSQSEGLSPIQSPLTSQTISPADSALPKGLLGEWVGEGLDDGRIVYLTFASNGTLKLQNVQHSEQTTYSVDLHKNPHYLNINQGDGTVDESIFEITDLGLRVEDGRGQACPTNFTDKAVILRKVNKSWDPALQGEWVGKNHIGQTTHLTLASNGLLKSEENGKQKVGTYLVDWSKNPPYLDVDQGNGLEELIFDVTDLGLRMEGGDSGQNRPHKFTSKAVILKKVDTSGQ
ncbi:MAG: hypothetical protein ABSC89_07550 [Verrucomicrobiota bacterium]